MHKKTLSLLLSLFFIFSFSTSRIVEYSLSIDNHSVHIAGKQTPALAINNSIPGPTIEAQLGDMLHINLTNNLEEETSLHWHGILLPNRMDGVPYITTPPIKPGESFTYEFPVTQTGTYWYHSHSGLQEQQGLYGAIVLRPEENIKNYDEEHILMLSDWTHEKPSKVLANVKKNSDFYSLKKDSIQSWHEVAKHGWKAIKLRFKNAFQRMFPMDLSDIGYDAFLINGKQSTLLSNADPGSRILLRIINASASSYFVLEYSGSPMKIVEADGMPVKPIEKQKIRIAIAETYNVIITIPKNKLYEFRASVEDGTGHASAFIGSGDLVAAPTLEKPKLVLMEHKHHKHTKKMPAKTLDNTNHTMHNTSKENSPNSSYLNTYAPLQSPTSTSFSKTHDIKTIKLNLTGTMERFIWTINDKPMYKSDKIIVKKNEIVRFILSNKTMMHHPIHLHGHFFRVLNGQGDFSPLKHTVNVAPFETVTIEFLADQEKDWVFHCHNLYHMNAGMMGVIHYEGSESDPDIIEYKTHLLKDHGNQWFYTGKFSSFSNFISLDGLITRQNENFILEARSNYKKNYDIELRYQHYLTQFFALYIGAEFEREQCEKSKIGTFGFVYMLPFLVSMDVRVDTQKNLRLELASDHQLTKRLLFNWYWNTDKEYMLEWHYTLHPQLLISANYDSREQWGAGISYNF